jgi:hypothetical protein
VHAEHLRMVNLNGRAEGKPITKPWSSETIRVETNRVWVLDVLFNLEAVSRALSKGNKPGILVCDPIIRLKTCSPTLSRFSEDCIRSLAEHGHSDEPSWAHGRF